MKNITEFDLLCDCICSGIKNNPHYENHYIEKSGKNLEITLFLDHQRELRIELRQGFLGVQMANLLLIRNDVDWNKVTRIYLKHSKNQVWRILSLKKYNKKFRSLFFKRTFDSQTIHQYLADF